MKSRRKIMKENREDKKYRKNRGKKRKKEAD
jgi:hypothetical protein